MTRPRPLVPVLSALLLALVTALLPAPRASAAGPEGQVTWGVHIALAPTWFDPAEASGMITPFMIYYAMHDAMVKPMPGNPVAPALAESWSVSKDGLAYDFVLRHAQGPVTVEGEVGYNAAAKGVTP